MTDPRPERRAEEPSDGQPSAPAPLPHPDEGELPKADTAIPTGGLTAMGTSTTELSLRRRLEGQRLGFGFGEAPAAVDPGMPVEVRATAAAISPAAETPPTQMVDLAPVRAAMQAVGQRQNETAPAAGEKPAPRGAAVGVLLVNLGTPEAPRAKAVRRYLREFLSDPRVIEKDTWTWRLVFRAVVLPFRPRRKARAYRKIWNRERNESPLKTITRSQAEKLGQGLAREDGEAVVEWAMRYGEPSIESGIKTLMSRGCERILLYPLYPQYSAATTATACDAAFRVLSRLRNQPALRVVPPYYADPAYIEAIAATIEAALAQLAFAPDAIVASYHGMPLEYVEKGDPYLEQCTATTALLRERLGIGENELIMTFQSRFGRAQWLQPYTDDVLRKLAREGFRNVAVVTPGFAADCLETLEEVAMESAHMFKKKGGNNFAFVPCLNDSEHGMAMIAEIVRRELSGWM